MGSEAGLWSHMRRKCKNFPCDLTRVENGVETGTPDVNGCYDAVEFWVELKFRETWPVRESTPVRFRHYTEDQRRWLRDRGKVGGRAWLLVQVGRCYMLFNWFYAQGVGLYNQEQMLLNASFVWYGALSGRQLLLALTQGGICIVRRQR